MLYSLAVHCGGDRLAPQASGLWLIPRVAETRPWRKILVEGDETSMLSADAQYAANLITLQKQPEMQPLVAQLAQMPLANLQLMQAPTGALIGVAWDIHTQGWHALCDLNDPLAAAEMAAEQMWS